MNLLQLTRASFYAFIFWIPLETIFVFQGEDSPVTVSRLLGLLLIGLSVLTRRVCYRRFPAGFWMVAWYFAIFSLSRLWVPSELDKRFFEEQMTLFQMVILFLLSINLLSDADFRARIFRFYGWWMTVVAAALVLGVFGDPFQVPEGRSTILDQDPNVAAGYFALGALCIAGDARLFAARGFLPRVSASIAALSTLIVAILHTGSRGGLVVLFVGLLALLFCGGKSARRERYVITGLILLLFAGMLFLEFQKGTSLALRLEQSFRKGDTAGRTGIWRIALAMFLERPLLGYGGANNVSTLGGHLNLVSRDTHNLFLAILTEVGLIGAVPFILALLRALWKSAFHGRRSGDALPFALMASLLVINMSLTGYHQKLFWIFFAAAVACGVEHDAARRKPRTPPPAAPGRVPA